MSQGKVVDGRSVEPMRSLILHLEVKVISGNHSLKNDQAQ